MLKRFNELALNTNVDVGISKEDLDSNEVYEKAGKFPVLAENEKAINAFENPFLIFGSRILLLKFGFIVQIKNSSVYRGVGN